ncbi:uncharacterized protein LOC110708187 [Chenopodium quinoa]|uniref:uncharacterized protein LOC110708187 n=1 Tax=Chenopodium quinoa TaxID=63459 RepID=UPI000B77CDB8|nr:uncharacterized protein LOC110708187 [Chenopodium quinoa]
MARTRKTAVDPEYKSDDSAGTPVEDVPFDQPGVPSTPSDEILEESGSSSDETDQEAGSTESTMTPDDPQVNEEAYNWPSTGSQNVPRSIRQMVRPGGELPQPPSQRRRVSGGPAPSSVGRTPAPERPTTTGKSLQSLGLSSEPTRSREPAPSSRVPSIASGSNAIGGGGTPQPDDQDTASRWPDMQN